MGVADLDGRGRVDLVVEVGLARVKGRRKRDRLEGGSRRVERLGRTVEHLGAAGRHDVAQLVVAVGGGGGLGQDGAGLGVEDDDGARVPVERRLGGLLDLRVQGEAHRRAGDLDAGERVEGASPVGVVCVPG